MTDEGITDHDMTDVAAHEFTIFGRHPHLPRFRWLVVWALVFLAGIWLTPMIATWVGDLNLTDLPHLYAFIFTMVVFDAVIPIFPSESLLTTGSNLAAQDGSTIVLWKLIVAGTAGAIAGDSLLYWLSRTVLRRTMADRVEQAQRSPKIARSMEVMSRSAGMLIVFGRFVPGLRFMIGATMGLTKYPYRRFLLWDSIGGFFWAAYTCVFSYAVASVIQNRPFLSIAASVVVTTGLLALLYVPVKRSWEATLPTDDAAGGETPRADESPRAEPTSS